MALRARSLLALALSPLLVTPLATCRARSDRSPSSPIFDVGRPPTADEIAAWDTDVNGRGDGLPAGSGSVKAGQEIYARACAACHGVNGEGGAGSQLVRPKVVEGTPRRNIATHWPYAPPLFDYIRRTMPPAAPWSMTDADVYAVLAFLLAENDLLAPDAVLDAATLKAIAMPALRRFVLDDRVGGPVVK